MSENERDGKISAVWEWLKGCPAIGDLYYAYGETEDGNTVLIPITAHKDRVVTLFIDGSAIRQCDFALARFESMTTEANAEENLRAQDAAEAIATWVDEMGEAGSFPHFPEGMEITRVETLPTETGFLAALGDRMAQFLLQFRIEYVSE